MQIVFNAWTSQGGSLVKTCQAGDVCLILGTGRSLEEEMATHFSILA